MKKLLASLSIIYSVTSLAGVNCTMPTPDSSEKRRKPEISGKVINIDVTGVAKVKSTRKKKYIV